MKQFLDSPDLLQTVARETEKVNEAARELCSGLSNEQLNWKPAPESWSIAQCLDHLSVSTAKFGPYVAGAIAKGRQRWPVSVAIAYRPTRLGGWLIKQLLPEATRKVRAPKVFRPAESSTITNALDRFLDQQNKFLAFVNDTRGIDYNKTRLRSPVTPVMRYSLADAYVITVVHGQRHLAQAQRVREASGFPKA